MNRPLQIDQLREKLLSQSKNGKRRVLVLHEEAGVGKTQLSIELVKSYKDDFDSVFWVDGSTEESLNWDIAALQRHLKGHVSSAEAQSYIQSSTNLSVAVSDVLQWFGVKDNNRWLLVIDNLMSEAHSSDDDNEVFKLEPYLPTADHGCILPRGAHRAWKIVSRLNWIRWILTKLRAYLQSILERNRQVSVPEEIAAKNT